MQRSVPPLAAILLVHANCGRRSTHEIEIAAWGRPITASDGHELAYYELTLAGAPSGETPRAVLHYIQGSELTSVTDATPNLAGPVEIGFKVALVERRGIGFDDIDLAVARASSTKEQRIRDHRDALAVALEGVPAGVPVVLVGASEGGDVAAALARLDRRVTHLVLLGTGGGWSQADELRHLLRERGELLGIREPAALEAVFARIRADPTSLEEWAGHPYRRWSSFLWARAGDDLLRLDLPIFLAHGTADTSVPVASARALAAEFQAAGKSNLTFWELPGAGHGWVDVQSGRSVFPRIEMHLISWLGVHGVLEPREVEALQRRVLQSHPDLFPPVHQASR